MPRGKRREVVDRFDCQRCGACCCNPDENRREAFAQFVEVSPKDRLTRRKDLMRRLVVVDDEGEAHLRLDRDERCLALRGRLGTRVWCTIYAWRPAACRRVEPGGARCLQYRRERGIGR